MLKRDPQSPLSSQISKNIQPPLLINSDGENECFFEGITRARKKSGENNDCEEKFSLNRKNSEAQLGTTKKIGRHRSFGYIRIKIWCWLLFR